MNKLLIGALLLLVNLSLKNQAGNAFDLAPDFVGYLLMLFGAKEVGHWSKNFRKLEKTAVFFAIYAGINWLRDAVNVTGGGFSFMGIVLGIMAVVIRMISLRWIIKGFFAVEAQTDFELKTSTMNNLWYALTVISVINTFVGIAPVVREISGIATVLLAVLFMAAFFRTKCYYDDAMAELEEESR